MVSSSPIVRYSVSWTDKIPRVGYFLFLELDCFDSLSWLVVFSDVAAVAIGRAALSHDGHEETWPPDSLVVDRLAARNALVPRLLSVGGFLGRKGQDWLHGRLLRALL